MPEGSEACVVRAAQRFFTEDVQRIFRIPQMHSSSPLPNPDFLLRRKQVEFQTGLARSTIYKLISLGLFPPPIRITNKAVAWPQSSISKWIDSRITASGREAKNGK
jgi:prophage regulatory protein